MSRWTQGATRPACSSWQTGWRRPTIMESGWRYLLLFVYAALSFTCGTLWSKFIYYKEVSHKNIYISSFWHQRAKIHPKWTHLDRDKRIWYLSPMRAAKVQASLRIRAVSPEPPLLANTGSESRGTFRQKARSLAPLNGWACAVEICHDGMREDTNSLDGAHL